MILKTQEEAEFWKAVFLEHLRIVAAGATGGWTAMRVRDALKFFLGVADDAALALRERRYPPDGEK